MREARCSRVWTLGCLGQQLLAQSVEEQRAVGRGLRLARLVAELGPAHAAAGAVGIGDAVDGLARRGREPRHRRHERHAVAVGQHGGVGRGQGEAPLVGGRAGVVHGQDAAGGLVLEPLAGVALGAAGARRELARGGRAAVRQGAVPAEPVAEVDRLGQLGAEDRTEDALGEGVDVAGGSGVVRHGHASDRTSVSLHGGCTTVGPTSAPVNPRWGATWPGAGVRAPTSRGS